MTRSFSDTSHVVGRMGTSRQLEEEEDEVEDGPAK
eukprot:CAMPEP_0182510698 /NCGR_PEP_ID=MMETSP1321-20130603/29212_1 /TAXON_ID=91990 /ORGANISM="Bolidomonas sp., Strain RCC1657" /LENGTH=34 /DNA_ID= /DNA_START= /DNA_END= /DNA_ORIENTATION=